MTCSQKSRPNMGCCHFLVLLYSASYISSCQSTFLPVHSNIKTCSTHILTVRYTIVLHAVDMPYSSGGIEDTAANLFLLPSSAKPSTSTNRDNLPLSVKPWEMMLIQCIRFAWTWICPNNVVSSGLCDPCLWFSLKNVCSKIACPMKNPCGESVRTQWSVLSLLHQLLSRMTS